MHFPPAGGFVTRADRPGRSFRFVFAVALETGFRIVELVPAGAYADAEEFRRARAVAVRRLQRATDERALALGAAARGEGAGPRGAVPGPGGVRAGGRGRGGRRAARPGGRGDLLHQPEALRLERLRPELPPRAQDHRPLHRVSQFPDVAGPVLRLEPRNGLRR